MAETETSAKLSGSVALVTGAGSGLGAATARALAAAGCAVACLDLDPDAAGRTASGIAAGDHDATGWGCDVADAAAVEAAVGEILARWGRVDIAVNAAGVDHTYPIHELTVAQWDHVIAVNLRGPFLVAKTVWPAMRRQGDGHIVNIASTAALRAWSGASAYHASKFGLLGFGRGLGMDGRADGIRVTTVIPGGMRTNFFERFVAQGISLPDEAGLQDPADVAAAIVFAVSAPPGSVVQELVVTPPNEPGWP